MSESLNNNEFDKVFSPKEVAVLFERAKEAELDEEGCILDSDLDRDLSLAIIDTGKQKYYQFEKEVWPYLKSRDEGLMAEAILTLGFRSRLHVPEFRDVAYDIWNNYEEQSECSDIRRSALSAWCTYYELSNDKEALAILYKALTKHLVVDMRSQAYRGILTTCDAFEKPGEFREISEMAHKRSHDYLNQNIDWERVHKLMKQYAPEVELVDMDQLPEDG
tara:strand:+ start:985 stop:1644 length:660 start_codon:yes stop_codon:yes gene_type:complete